MFKNILTAIGNSFTNTYRQRSSEEIVAEIHNAFDTAAEKAHVEAKTILNDLKEKGIDNSISHAEKLRELGFVNTKFVKEVRQKEKVISMNKETAGKIEYWMVNYPTLKFLTIDMLNIICEKYGLIYTAVNRYIKDIPAKNLEELSKVVKLNHEDFLREKTYYTIVPHTNTKKHIKAFIVGKQFTDTELRHMHSQWELARFLQKKGVKINNSDDCADLGVRSHTEKFDGLFIAAPPSHFDLEGMDKTSKNGYNVLSTTTRKMEAPDPIVFRYCKDGIQVLTKWGIEGQDPMLVNEVMN